MIQSCVVIEYLTTSVILMTIINLCMYSKGMAPLKELALANNLDPDET